MRSDCRVASPKALDVEFVGVLNIDAADGFISSGIQDEKAIP